MAQFIPAVAKSLVTAFSIENKEADLVSLGVLNPNLKAEATLDPPSDLLLSGRKQAPYLSKFLRALLSFSSNRA